MARRVCVEPPTLLGSATLGLAPLVEQRRFPSPLGHGITAPRNVEPPAVLPIFMVIASA
jgi:hypothetical protein